MDVATPLNCVYQIIGDSVEVDFNKALGSDRTVIYRSVDGNQQFWRGSVDNASFTDTNRDGTLEYYLLAVHPNGERSERVPCTDVSEDVGENPPVQNVLPVSECSVSFGANDAEVTYPASDIANAEYIVSRSVDGSQIWWRGRVSETTFSDSIRPGEIVYFVEVKAGATRSEQIQCSLN